LPGGLLIFQFRMPTGKIGGKSTLKLVPEPGAGAIRLYWQGKVASPLLRAGLERLNDLLQEHRFANVLCDIRSAEVPDEEDMVWIWEDWLPRAAAAGFKKFSAAEPTMVITLLSAKKTSIHAQKQGVEGKCFASLEAARYWLATQ